ncbi:MAG TPA: nickel-type superoxide dismutase maturation protease [Tepidiformaceae bacterium]|nr:nickel-type superoxide dismutase maturation protease [Tepidiformaceae bacterium]
MKLWKGASRLWRAFSFLLTLLVLLRMLRRFSRYEVAGESMLPTLRPGDFLIVDRAAYLHAPPSPGHLVIAADPRAPENDLVKRLAGVRASDGAAWLEGDNPSHSTDSRAFGWVPPESLRGRARFRYWPPRGAGRL